MGRGEALVELDLDQGGGSMKTATSIVDQQLRSVIAIPLYSRVRETGQAGQPVGLLYLDSRRPAAFEGLGRRVLDALAIEAASVIDNARMVTRERERREMEQDLEIARHIQERLLPRELGRYGEFEVSGCNRPCHAVGGDYFDVVQSGPDRIAFVIADVVGKGLSAALLTAMLQGGFAGITLTPEPGRLVEHLNRYVWGRSEPNRYATAFIGVLDAEGQMDYINAGHLPALLVAPNGIAKRLESGSHPVGMFADTVFHPGRVALSRGETLVLFTDGVTEATSREGEEFGLTRLTRLVESVSDRPVAAIQTAILEAVEEFTAGREAEDDLTVLIVRYGRA
jgi:serine phosphatase RsbU (regulator of sigma subunit)